MNGLLIVGVAVLVLGPMLLVQAVLLRVVASSIGANSRGFVGSAAIVATMLLLVAGAVTVGYLAGSWLVGAIAVIAVGAVSVAIIAKGMSVSWPRAVLATLVTLSIAVGWTAVAAVSSLPIFARNFVMAGNGMAPTLLGEHVTIACPDCGEPAVCSPPFDQRGSGWVICGRERTTHFLEGLPKSTAPPDRFVVNEWAKPRRWDVVAFRNPATPDVIYAKRLVGLPNEEIVIREGKVFVDGDVLELPAALAGTFYEDKLEFLPPLHGTATNPARLGPNEYFVLGDFSTSSQDSRTWPSGAPGYPPYAVPAENIVGVVQFIYWPPGRAGKVE